MEEYRKIIFVCDDNTCRSVIAETIFNKVKGQRELEVLSRGIVVLIPEPLNPKAVAVLKAQKLEPVKEYSEPLVVEDFVPDTLILTMTQEEAISITEKFADYLVGVTLATIRGFTGQEGDFGMPMGTVTEYGQFYEMMDMSVKMAAEILFRDQAAKEASIDIDTEIVEAIVRETEQE
jgi:protein-tyrosine-phosphatase